MGERRIAGLAGDESLFRVAPRALLFAPQRGWPAGSVSGRVMGQMKLVRGGRAGADEVGAWGRYETQRLMLKFKVSGQPVTSQVRSMTQMLGFVFSE